MLIRYVPLQAPLSDASLPTSPSAVCLGNFDGIHIGHEALVKATIALAKSMSRELGKKVRACALFFSPTPSDCISDGPKAMQGHIMTDEEKLLRFQMLGLDGVYICDFPSIRKESPDQFIREILWKQCFCRGVVCGFNYRFGYQAQGNADTLRQYFDCPPNFYFCLVPEVKYHGETVSSSLIRKYLAKGDMETASELLGHSFSLRHTVVHGKSIGKALGYPTLNYVFQGKKIIPHWGIYATQTEIDGHMYSSVTNIGVCPTVDKDGGQVTCETFLIHCPESTDLYGKTVTIHFYHKLRDEKKFDSVQTLSEAISQDVAQTKEYFLVHNRFEKTE